MNENHPFEIIDFHMHPYMVTEQNIFYYKDDCGMSFNTTLDVMDKLGVRHFCGAVLGPKMEEDAPREEMARRLRYDNDCALELHRIYGDRYIPGFKVNPKLVRESCEEIERMHQQGFNLIGELCPYMEGWIDMYADPAFYEILDVAKQYGMVVDIHNELPKADDITKLMADNKDVQFVIAHPNCFKNLDKNIERLKMSENFHIDLSAIPIYNGITRSIINAVGKERVLFGSDFPICNLGMHIGAVLWDPFLTDDEKEHVFSLNAKRLLHL